MKIDKLGELFDKPNAQPLFKITEKINEIIDAFNKFNNNHEAVNEIFSRTVYDDIAGTINFMELRLKELEGKTHAQQSDIQKCFADYGKIIDHINSEKLDPKPAGSEWCEALFLKLKEKSEDSEKLLPCPFCQHSCKILEHIIDGTPHYGIICSNNGCQVKPSSHIYYALEKDAIKAWNTRK